jgi:hypothetical protein
MKAFHLGTSLAILKLPTTFVFFAVVVQLLIGLTPTKSLAQYQSYFGLESTSWNTYLINIEGEGLYDSNFVKKDTLIGAKTYKYLLSKNYGDTSNGGVNLLREDTVSGTLWLRSMFHFADVNGNDSVALDTMDRVISSMNLNQGDTFTFETVTPYPLHLRQYVVDSVYFMNNRKHIALNAGIWNPPIIRLMFIEGVGPNCYINWMSYGPALNTYLLCQNKDETLSYMHADSFLIGQCRFEIPKSVHQLDGGAKVNLQVFPNPAIDYLDISYQLDDNDNRFGKQWVLMNALGQVVGREFLAPAHHALKIRHNISGLAPGIYTWKLEGTSERGKLVIEQ